MPQHTAFAIAFSESPPSNHKYLFLLNLNQKVIPLKTWHDT
jgi:hypothetical protein